MGRAGTAAHGHAELRTFLQTAVPQLATEGKARIARLFLDERAIAAIIVLQSGDRCGVAAYDRQVRGFLPPLAGTAALRSLAECIYDLQTQWHESDFTTMLSELRHRQAKRAEIGLQCTGIISAGSGKAGRSQLTVERQDTDRLASARIAWREVIQARHLRRQIGAHRPRGARECRPDHP